MHRNNNSARLRKQLPKNKRLTNHALEAKGGTGTGPAQPPHTFVISICHCSADQDKPQG